uniref:Uncharacterized protein n=1 Tax=Arundo donax TaxID=35708 RepID=A0A0A9B4E9_ARUDO
MRTSKRLQSHQETKGNAGTAKPMNCMTTATTLRGDKLTGLLKKGKERTLPNSATARGLFVRSLQIQASMNT